MLLYMKLLTFLAVLGISQGCSECDFPHPQQRFCDAPYVFRATVSSSQVLPKPEPDADMPKLHIILSPWPINYKYELAVTKIYKNSDSVNLTAEPFIMYASFGPGFCGLPPGGYVGKDFLIFGKALRPEDAGSLQPQITTCGNTMPWDEVPQREQDLLENAFGQACQECTIKHECNNQDECMLNDTCTWNVQKNFMDLCLWDKVCKKMDDGKCEWSDRNKCDFEDMPDWMKNGTVSLDSAED